MDKKITLELLNQIKYLFDSCKIYGTDDDFNLEFHIGTAKRILQIMESEHETQKNKLESKS